MLAFVYAGQGAQHPGEGADFYQEYPLFRETFDQAAEAAALVTPMDLKQLSFTGPAEALSETRVTQPAMAAFSAGVTKLLDEEAIRPEMALGLSLGEYSALYAAGVFDEKTLITLLAKRGRFMEEASEGLAVKMSAVLGTERSVVEACCREAAESTGMVAAAANYNCPGQIVISGELAAVTLAGEKLKAAGAGRIMPLKVSGPFHTALMAPAGAALEKEFSDVTFRTPEARVVFNCIGREKTEAETIPELLVRQVQSPVYLEDSFRYMEAQGVHKIIEIGPGKTLAKLIRKTCPNIPVVSIDSTEDFREALRFAREAS